MQKSKLTNKSPAAEIDIFPNVFLSRYLSHIQYDCAASTKIGIFQLEFQFVFSSRPMTLEMPFLLSFYIFSCTVQQLKLEKDRNLQTLGLAECKWQFQIWTSAFH